MDGLWFLESNSSERLSLYMIPCDLEIVQDAGLLLILRIGPFVAAEWNFGVIPVWLHYVPGSVFRTDNEPFKVENEYGFYETAYCEGGKSYTQWAAKMALAQNTGVPRIMCQQWGAPDPVKNKASLTLKCPMNTQVSAFKFASYGIPTGSCQSYAIGDCHDPDSTSIVEKFCLNKNKCIVELTKDNFKMELCPGMMKKLAVEATCS